MKQKTISGGARQAILRSLDSAVSSLLALISREYAQLVCTCTCLLVSHRCVSLLVRVWALDVWGELVPSKIFNPPFPVLKAGHSMSYSCVCDVCREWVNEVGFFSCLASVLCTCFSCTYNLVIFLWRVCMHMMPRVLHFIKFIFM